MDSQIKLMLLDFDGTLADTRRANAQAYAAAFREAGYLLTEEEYLEKYFGMRCDEFLTRFGIADPAERERLRLRKIALYPAFFDTVQLNRPLWEFCQSFRTQGGRVWIVSTGSRANIDNAMRHLGISAPCPAATPSDHILPTSVAASNNAAPVPHNDTPHTASVSHDISASHAAPHDGIDGILAGPDIARSKPDPDCFLEAMRREGVTPRETLIFEDSDIGLEAARRSGAAYIKVTL